MRVGRFELIDDRVLGAVCFVDAVTGLPVRESVEVAGARTFRNASGLVVLRGVEGAPAELEHYHQRFRSLPHGDEPGPRTVTATLQATPHGQRYLARSFDLKLPLPDPGSNQSNDVFDPVEVILYPGANYPTEPQWAVIRARVVQKDSDPARPLVGVLVSAVTQAGAPNPNVILGRGLSDQRGEALVIVSGLRPATFAAPESILDLEVRRDKRTPAMADPDGLLDAAGNEPWLVVEQHADVIVAPGRRTVVSITMG